MNPEEKEGEKTPDLTPDEVHEGDIGGKDNESVGDEGIEKEGGMNEGEEGGGGAYGRPRELGEDEPPA